MQTELHTPGPLLTPDGRLAQVGWSRQPLLDCNLESAHFYRWRAPQRWRIKRWDYYGLTPPTDFYSFAILGRKKVEYLPWPISQPAIIPGDPNE